MQKESLTSRGRYSRKRILEQAAQLVGKKGVRGMTLDDIRAAASVSKSQLYHYFANKDDLVLAVIEQQTNNTIEVQQPFIAHLDSWENLERWCEHLITLQAENHCTGGCPIGTLANELADQDEAARIALTHSFDQYGQGLLEGFTRMRERGELRAHADPAELATVVLTSLEGGLLLNKTYRTTQPLQIALHAAIAYARSFASSSDAS
jgi:TetR/AcrR family transcriptional regulator, transcriptional repressor for nem operon